MNYAAGRFPTSTKTKIKTEWGTILKITTYDPDDGEFPPKEEYKIKPKCQFCGNPVDCYCYNDDNCDSGMDLFEKALEDLKKKWMCMSTSCIIQGLKEYDPDRYKELKDLYEDDKESIADEIRDNLPDMDGGEGSSCDT